MQHTSCTKEMNDLAAFLESVIPKVWLNNSHRSMHAHGLFVVNTESVKQTMLEEVMIEDSFVCALCLSKCIMLSQVAISTLIAG